MHKRTLALSLVLLALPGAVLASCGSSTPAEAVDAGLPPCEQECQDETAVRAVRETMKLVYNLTLQGRDAGPQDASVVCPKGGYAYVFGEATSNAEQGATFVKLTYEAHACHYTQRDDDAEESYDITLDGTIVQEGVIAVQPSSSTALVMKSENVSVTGTIRLPEVSYRAEGCKLDMTQNGNKLTATFCGRTVGVDL